MSEPGVNNSSLDDGEGGRNGQNGQAPVPEQPMMMVSPGAQLAALRKERGWTVEQVASQLNLAPRQIVAIESDDYPALPGMPIVRGFIRAYAKLLKIDATPLLAMVGGETIFVNESLVPKKTLSTPFSEKRVPSMTERPELSSKWIIGVLLAVLLGVAIWAAQKGEIGVASKPVPAKEVSAPTPATEAVQTPPEQNAASAPATGTATAPAPASAVAPSTAPAAGNAPVTPPVAANATTAPAAPANASPAPTPATDNAAPAGKDTLVLKARDESWIEIRRENNNSIAVSRILKPGESVSYEVAEPVAVVIGNAAGIDASLRGKPVEMKANKSNVARLNLK